MRVWRIRVGAALTGLLLMMLAAALFSCGNNSDQGNRGSLTIYSGRSQSLIGPIIQQFGETTGVKILVKYAGTPQLAATLLEEGDRNKADVFFAQDPSGLGAVENLLVKLPADLLALVPNWARSPQGNWVGLSGRARTVVYNTERVTEADLPDEIFDFVDPQWLGRIGWAPSNASFQTMVTAMRAVWGEDKTRSWLEGIQANDPQVYPKNTPIVAATASGEIDVGFVNHYYLHRFLAEKVESFQARNYHFRLGGPGNIILVAGAGILANSDNKDTAKQFLNYMLSPVAQRYFADETFEYPLIAAIETQRGLVPLSAIAHPNIPLKQLADLQGTQALLRDVSILP